MECNAADKLMMKYMDQLLSETEEAELGRHLAVCTVCKEDFMVYKHLTEQFESECLFFPPSNFEERVMSEIALITPDYRLAPSTDIATGVTLGILSIFIGFSIIMSTYSAEIMGFLSGYPLLHNVFAGVIFIFDKAADLLYNFGQWVTMFTDNLALKLDTAQPVILALAVGLLAAQYIVRFKARGRVVN